MLLARVAGADHFLPPPAIRSPSPSVLELELRGDHRRCLAHLGDDDEAPTLLCATPFCKIRPAPGSAPEQTARRTTSPPLRRTAVPATTPPKRCGGQRWLGGDRFLFAGSDPAPIRESSNVVVVAAAQGAGAVRQGAGSVRGGRGGETGNLGTPVGGLWTALLKCPRHGWTCLSRLPPADTVAANSARDGTRQPGAPRLANGGGGRTRGPANRRHITRDAGRASHRRSSRHEPQAENHRSDVHSC